MPKLNQGCALVILDFEYTEYTLEICVKINSQCHESADPFFVCCPDYLVQEGATKGCLGI